MKSSGCGTTDTRIEQAILFPIGRGWRKWDLGLVRIATKDQCDVAYGVYQIGIKRFTDLLYHFAPLLAIGCVESHF